MTDLQLPPSADLRWRDPYIKVDDVPVYHAVHDILLSLTAGGPDVDTVVASRWSRPGDTTNAAEQAAKVIVQHIDAVPALQTLIDTVPESAWETEAGRARHNIKEIRVCDVTEARFRHGDPSGASVIGWLTRVENALVFRIASSGFKPLYRADGDEQNAQSQAVIEVCKFVAAKLGLGRRMSLRLSDDVSRKGRLAVELGRYDRWMQRLKVHFFLGDKDYDYEGWGQLISSLENRRSEEDRGDKVESLLRGKIRALAAGSIPAAITSLPPYLTHITDPTSSQLDQRLRDGTRLVTAWDPKVLPAVWEWIAAYADRASDSELAAILCRHQVPTPAPAVPGVKEHVSPLRDTTWDRLPPDEAKRRARRWLLSDSRYEPIPAEADDLQRAQLERHNARVVRKLECLRSGTYLWMQRNPTHTESRIADVEVERFGLLDEGLIVMPVEMEWPAQHVVEEVDGRSVVTDELVLDESGHPVPWLHAGCDPAVLDAAIARIIADGTGYAERRRHARGKMTRALTIKRWTTKDELDDGTVDARQWYALPKGQHRPELGHWAARWIVWRPAPIADDPERGLNHKWSELIDDLAKRKDRRRWSDRHVATIREGQLVTWAYEALRDAALEALDTDVALRSPDTDRRAAEAAARIRASEEAAQHCRARAQEARQAAKGYEVAAMTALGVGDIAEHQRLLAEGATQLADASELDAEAARYSDLAATEPTLDADADVSSLARLLEVLRRAGLENDGLVSPDVAVLLEPLFDRWRFVPTSSGVRVTCRALLPLTDGGTVVLPLEGLLPDSAYGKGVKDFYGVQIIGQMLAGRDLDTIARSSTRPTSRAALVVVARDALTSRGVACYRATALLDHPHEDALASVWSALGGEEPAACTWTPAFQRHMLRTYSEGGWSKSACPTSAMSDAHRVFKVLTQRPSGVPLRDLAAAADVDAVVIKRLVTPQAASKSHRQRPRMLEWVPGREGLEVRALRCPHPDCPAPASRRWATIAVLLPETAPEPGGVGGVLCPACSRIPRGDLADVVFPAAWHQPVSRAGKGLLGSVREQAMTEVVTVGPVQDLPPAAAPIITVAELEEQHDLPRPLIKQILSEAGLQPLRVRGQGRDGRVAWDATAATGALAAAWTDGPRDLHAYRRSALRVTAAAKRAGVRPADIRAAAAAGVLPSYWNLRGHLKVLVDDLDGWTGRVSGAQETAAA